MLHLLQIPMAIGSKPILAVESFGMKSYPSGWQRRLLSPTAHLSPV